LYRIEVSMLRWVCGLELKDWKFNAEIRELFRRLENGSGVGVRLKVGDKY